MLNHLLFVKSYTYCAEAICNVICILEENNFYVLTNLSAAWFLILPIDQLLIIHLFHTYNEYLSPHETSIRGILSKSLTGILMGVFQYADKHSSILQLNFSSRNERQGSSTHIPHSHHISSMEYLAKNLDHIRKPFIICLYLFKKPGLWGKM